MVRPVDSLSVVLLLYFYGCKVNTLVKSNALWTTMIMDKKFNKFTKSSFDTRFACTEDKSITRININNLRKTKHCPFNKINGPLQSTCHQVTRQSLGIQCHIGTQCWSLLLALITSSIDISLGEWKLMLLSLHITSISATMCTLLMDPLDNDTDSWGQSVLSEEGIST